MIWLGDFNQHHPQWEEERNCHLFTWQNLDASQTLIDAIICCEIDKHITSIHSYHLSSIYSQLPLLDQNIHIYINPACINTTVHIPNNHHYNTLSSTLYQLTRWDINRRPHICCSRQHICHKRQFHFTHCFISILSQIFIKWILNILESNE